MSSDISIVILAAGLGTRMKSRRAKVLHRAGGQTLVEHVVDAARTQAAPEAIVTVTGHQAEAVEELLTPHAIRFARQTEQKGTGHAVAMAKPLLADRPGLLIVLYGDCPLLSAATLTRLVAQHRAGSAAATVITTLLDDPTGYGRMVTNAAGEVEAIVEQKAATPEQLAIREINSGIYCFDAPLLWGHLDEIGTNNPAGEYYLTDMVEILRRHGHRIATLRLADPNEILGINTRVELALVDRIFRDRKARELMLEGVTIEKPETVTIDLPVRIGLESTVEAFAQIRGRSVIGENCRIGAGAILENVELGDGVEIHPYTHISQCRIESGAHVGPFARLRMNTHVEEGAHIGNFVELKKTRLGRGSKSMHLAYLGDATIGASANIGAGTITCNYDGEKKHATQIGDRAFVGSNSTLVAPVEIAADAYVAAGSVITDTVPSEALGLGRARQVNKEGWVKQRKTKKK
ncbi:MAG: bifunctional UDP-N-acetylglucosamine diphosphorylase/glucosamine-1-phosphate N-acetyltransferase GlmU [Bryobacteraceae bacterium]|nr:bifunctional UDP-N-acetylglucosamine diphosphorylase/glucosamine-1-phosphate N-acetyltransferase GlmU [Bryobacteraceae bacterium]